MMTNILIIGDIVRTETGHDMIIGFTPDDKAVLKSGGISDKEHFDIIGNYNDTEHKLVLYNRQGVITCDMDL